MVELAAPVTIGDDVIGQPVSEAPIVIHAAYPTVSACVTRVRNVHQYLPMLDRRAGVNHVTECIACDAAWQNKLGLIDNRAHMRRCCTCASCETVFVCQRMSVTVEGDF